MRSKVAPHILALPEVIRVQALTMKQTRSVDENKELRDLLRKNLALTQQQTWDLARLESLGLPE